MQISSRTGKVLIQSSDLNQLCCFTRLVERIRTNCEHDIAVIADDVITQLERLEAAMQENYDSRRKVKVEE